MRAITNLQGYRAIEDIHKSREYNYELTKNMADKERIDYYNNRGREVQRKLERMKTANV